MELNIDELNAEAEIDLQFDRTNPTSAMERISKLSTCREKWARYKHIARMEMKKFEMERDRIYAERFEWYSNDSPRQYHRGDIPTVLKKDDKVRAANARLELSRGNVEYIEDVIKSIDQLQWNLSNFTKLYIFLNGG